MARIGGNVLFFFFTLICFLRVEFSTAQVISGFSSGTYTFNENDATIFEVITASGIGESGSVSCTFFATPDVFGSELAITPNSFVLTSATATVTVEIDPLDDDNQCDTITTTINLFCEGLTITGFSQFDVTIIDNDADAGACGDPHLIQNVYGRYENGDEIRKSICYDIYGKTGNEFELLNDEQLKTSVIFELRDDYYIGRTFFKSPFGQINVTNEEIFLLSGERISWNNFENFFKNRYVFKNNLKIEMKGKSLSIIYENNDNRSFGIIVQRIHQKYGTTYLNVLIDRLTGKNGVFDEKHGGIMGEISNKNYTFYRPVQQNLDFEMMKINGKYTKSFVKRSTGSGVSGECHYMKLDDLLYPKNINFFKKIK